jgi:hypothetical protein
MNFTLQMRINPETGEYEKYYRLKKRSGSIGLICQEATAFLKD